MLLQGQDNAVGDDCSQDHVFKWSVGVKELKVKLNTFLNQMHNYNK